ncbi:MAG: alpha-L-fucosidase [Bacteroides sp.]|jgi:alpha-L-fucosidase|nr:alpha-L-fucosidase [Bacteroides sp.]MCI1681329.1 alpha-L-fucosidase [Bacteroides sp.]
MGIKKILVTLFVLFMSLSTPYSQIVYKSNWESLDKRPIPQWYADAKFGIFIHWGVYSVPAWAPTKGKVYEKYAEWYWARQNPSDNPSEQFTHFHNSIYGEKIKYPDFVNSFRTELFDPERWADIFKQSGATYVVLTAKHHDGFALWPSEQAWNWNSVDVGPHRDLAGDLAKSIKLRGLHMGFYYSLYEWYNPLYKKDISQYVDNHMIPQMKDLVNRYRPDILWTDGEWEHSSEEWKSTSFLSWLYNESPVKGTIVVNDRWGKDTRGKHGGFYTTEYDISGDQSAAKGKTGHPWEECRGIGGSFGYNRNENLEDYATSKALIDLLVEKVSRGGNLLLNVGPTADGRIPVIMQERLKDIGDWLAVNGEAIYGTHAWNKFPDLNEKANCFFTVKGKDLYLIITEWQRQPITVDGVAKTTAISLLGFEGNVKYSLANNRLTIIPPIISPSDDHCRYAWVFKIAGGGIN